MPEHATTETPQPAPRRPDPAVERDNAYFWNAAKRGELVSRTCDHCHGMQHPPVPMCPICHGLAWTEKKLSGRGTITGWIKSHFPPTPFFDYPLLIVTVMLEEGIELVSNLIDADQIDPSDYVGLAVDVTFAPTRGGWAVPIFRPAA